MRRILACCEVQLPPSGLVGRLRPCVLDADRAYVNAQCMHVSCGRSGDLLALETALRSMAISILARDRFESRLEYQAFGTPGSRSLAAIFTNSARESAFIFCITLPRCAFTVISLMPSSPPTCLFNRPETTSAITCRSRCVSDA